MPRSLSDPEFNQFTHDEADVIQALENAPGPLVDPAGGTYGQSKIVSWGGLSVLIYLGPAVVDDQGVQWSNVYLSDVSDARQLQAISIPGYSSPPQSMLDTLPQATVDTIAEEAAALGKLLSAAGKAAQIAASNIVPILVGIGVIVVLILMRK